jgi:hypothetical protein
VRRQSLARFLSLTRGGEAAHPGRGPAHRRQHRQAAGAAAPGGRLRLGRPRAAAALPPQKRGYAPLATKALHGLARRRCGQFGCRWPREGCPSARRERCMLVPVTCRSASMALLSRLRCARSVTLIPDLTEWTAFARTGGTRSRRLPLDARRPASRMMKHASISSTDHVAGGIAARSPSLTRGSFGGSRRA